LSLTNKLLHKVFYKITYNEDSRKLTIILQTVNEFITT